MSIHTKFWVVLNGLAPLYISELIKQYKTTLVLWSFHTVYQQKKSAGFSAFANRAPNLWNSLPSKLLAQGNS